MLRSTSLFNRHIFHSSGFHHICNIKCRLDCRYSPQNIFNAKNFNPHKKPISLLNVPICTQGMQRTWWPEAGTIIVTGPYWTLWTKCSKIWIIMQWFSFKKTYFKMSSATWQPFCSGLNVINYCQISNISHTQSQWEWRCSTDRRCSNYTWGIKNSVAYQGMTYIRGLTVNHQSRLPGQIALTCKTTAHIYYFKQKHYL